MLLSFLDRARAIHGNRYTYDRVEYAGTKKKVAIGCPEHGLFEQSPEKHLGPQAGLPCVR